MPFRSQVLQSLNAIRRQDSNLEHECMIMHDIQILDFAKHLLKQMKICHESFANRTHTYIHCGHTWWITSLYGHTSQPSGGFLHIALPNCLLSGSRRPCFLSSTSPSHRSWRNTHTHTHTAMSFILRATAQHMTNVSTRDQRLNTWPTSQHVTNVSTRHQHLNTWPTSQHVTNVSTRHQHLNTWPTSQHVTNTSPTSQHATNVSTRDQRLNTWPTRDQRLNTWLTSEHITNVSTRDQRLISIGASQQTGMCKCIKHTHLAYMCRNRNGTLGVGYVLYNSIKERTCCAIKERTLILVWLYNSIRERICVIIILVNTFQWLLYISAQQKWSLFLGCREASISLFSGKRHWEKS